MIETNEQKRLKYGTCPQVHSDHQHVSFAPNIKRSQDFLILVHSQVLQILVLWISTKTLLYQYRINFTDQINFPLNGKQIEGKQQETKSPSMVLHCTFFFSLFFCITNFFVDNATYIHINNNKRGS